MAFFLRGGCAPHLRRLFREHSAHGFAFVVGAGVISSNFTSTRKGHVSSWPMPTRYTHCEGEADSFEKLLTGVKAAGAEEIDMTILADRLAKRTDRHLIWGVLRDGDRRLKRVKIFHSEYAPPQPVIEDDAVAGGRKITAVVELGDEMNGHQGIVHGGFTSALIDDLFGWAASAEARRQLGEGFGMTMTANLNVNYRAPMASNATYEVEVWSEKVVRSKKIYLTAVVKDAQGKVCIEASSLYIIIRSKSTKS